MIGLWIRKGEENAKRRRSKAKNIDPRKTEITIKTEARNMNNTLENLKESTTIERYNAERQEHIAISVLFAIGIILQIAAHAIL